MRKFSWSDKDLVWLHFSEHFLPSPDRAEPGLRGVFAERLIAALDIGGATAERIRQHYDVTPTAPTPEESERPVTVEVVPIETSREYGSSDRLLRLILWDVDPDDGRRSIADMVEYSAIYLRSQVGKTDRSNRDFVVYNGFVATGPAIRAALAKLAQEENAYTQDQ